MGCSPLVLAIVIQQDPSDLAQRVMAGERRALAKAITLVESTRPDHRRDANRLLDSVCAAQKGAKSAMRIGISGAPGVGKSTLIETLGLFLIDHDHRVAVLAIDPSSVRTGGSILGDKTRMIELSRNPSAFIRPSASHGMLGGVANRTGEAVMLAESAGYDVVIVETVGVGQSEVAVASITDLFVLLVSPTGGDDLQGIKRGIMELVDLVLVNKSDGDLVALAERTAVDYRHALSLLRPKSGHPTPEVLPCSALSRTGLGPLWQTVADLWRDLNQAGHIEKLRQDQALEAFDREIETILLRRLLSSPSASELRQALGSEVRSGLIAPTSAAATLTNRVLGSASAQTGEYP